MRARPFFPFFLHFAIAPAPMGSLLSSPGALPWVAAARTLARIPVATLSWTAAAGALGYAVQLGNGHLNADAIILLEWSLGLSLLAVIVPRLATAPTMSSISALALFGLLVFQLCELYASAPGIYLTDSTARGLRPFRLGVVLAGVLCAALATNELAPRRRFALLSTLLLALHFAMGVWLIHASPNPFIDTYVFQRDSVTALSVGENPYAITFPNIYRDEANYGPGLSHEGRLTFGFVYPPLSLLLAAVGKIVGGDIRFAQLLATTLAGACMLALGAGQRVASLAAAVFLFTPRGFFVLEQSWTEPYLVFLFAWMCLSAVRRARALPHVVGLLLSIKQHMALVVPLLWLLPNLPRSGKSLWVYLLRVFGTALAVTLPFALWSPSAFYRSAIAMQFYQPHRPDALSFAATWAIDHGGEQLPQYIPFVCAIAAIAVSVWRAPRTVSGFAGSVAFVYLVFFAFAKQAFCNYYYYVIGLLCCAIAGDRAPTGRAHSQLGATVWRALHGEPR